jgi:hypothetical protein
MSRPPPTTAESAAKAFRAAVFKPAEGIFLFHPRALERLVSEHLEPFGCTGSIPSLAYHVMSREDFLSALEYENPEALVVIEGLALPEYVILLPIPLDLRLDHAAFIGLLREYWAHRFEGEIARAWQMARDRETDRMRFGPARLRALIGEIALEEVRDVLTRDGVLPTGLDDTLVCRAFVALVMRLRYFSPGARGYFFPAIHDWRALDAWIGESGLDLPPPSLDGPIPALLESSRPDPGCGYPTRLPLLPSGFPYAESDVDLEIHRSVRALAAKLGSPTPQHEPAIDTTPWLQIRFQIQGTSMDRCVAAFHPDPRSSRRDWLTRLQDLALVLIAIILEPLLELPNRLWRRSSPHPSQGLRLALYLPLFSLAVRRARRADRAEHYTAAIAHLAVARRRFASMFDPSTAESSRVLMLIDQRHRGAEESLANRLASPWKLNAGMSRELNALIQRLGDAILDRKPVALDLFRDLERVLIESRATYYQLNPIAWLRSLGRVPVRQILPFQAALKALRLLDTVRNRLELLGWPIEDVERFSRPLNALSGRLTEHLEHQLKPHLKRALEEAGFTPRTHREEVAFNKLLRELLDVIEHRRHLKFTDVRDIVARNLLRLPDLTLDEWRTGDRLARFDRSAERALPGLYRPGEIYIKGLQRLGAPLFGTAQGRQLLRHLIIPVGLAFLGLKTLDVLIGILPTLEATFHLTSLWLILGLGLAINGLAYTRAGRLGVRVFLRVLWWTLRLLLFDGLRRFLRWPPVRRILETELVRGLDRNLLRPFLSGTLLMLPVIGLASLIEGNLIELNLSLAALTLVLGVLIRNTPGGRRLLDDLVSAGGQFLRRINQTLVIGLIQELMLFFKEVTRRFQQGLHRIEERLSHHLGESWIGLAFKALLMPVWRVLEWVIQFYVTVLVEPQINPIKHFPLVTIAHKLMLPFLPLITSLMVEMLNPILPKWISIPFVTLTVLLLPGLAGFLVWELKENWKIYAANHSRSTNEVDVKPGLYAVRREHLTLVPIEPAIIGSHGETLRGFLRRGFHSGTLPKSFDRLRRVMRRQIEHEVETPQRLREAQRHLTEIERTVGVFCDRELAYALRRRCQDPNCVLMSVWTRRPRLATTSFELTLDLRLKPPHERARIELRLCLCLHEPDLRLTVVMQGDREALGATCRERIREDIRVFGARAGATELSIDLG